MYMQQYIYRYIILLLNIKYHIKIKNVKCFMIYQSRQFSMIEIRKPKKMQCFLSKLIY